MNDMQHPRPADPMPLSGIERQIRAHEQVGGLGPFAPQRLALHLAPGHDGAALAEAARLMILAHPAFAARLETLPGGEVLRRQDDAKRPAMTIHAVSDDPAADAMRHLASLSPELAAVDLFPGRDGSHVLAIALHPILGDAATLAAMEGSLLAAMAGQPTARLGLRPPAAPPLRDALPRWRARLGAGHVIARLPQRHGGSEGTVRLTASRDLPGDLVRDMDDPEEVLATALAALLARYGGHDRLRFALGQPSPDPARRGEDILPLCADYDPAEGFAAMRLRIAAAISDIRADRLPSEALVQDMLRQAGADRHPLGAVVLHVRHAAPLPQGVARLATPRPAAQGECVILAETLPEGGIRLTADHPEGLHEPALIARFLCHLERLLTAALADPHRPLAGIALLEDDELDRLSAPYPDDAPVDPRATHQMIAAHARQTPDKLAVICGGDRLTHDQMNRAANRLAHRLIALGVGAEIPVAILIERGAEALVAILAAMKAGGAYIPVEPDHPASRNHHIMTDAGVHVVLTRTRFRDRLPDGLAAHVLCIDDLPAGDFPETDPAVTIHPDQLAYVMYTSGSTGKPKGVAVEHGPLSLHNQTTARVYEMSADSRELPFLPFSSDGGHERWMVPLMMGGSVVIPDGPLWTPEETLAAMRRHGCNNASIPTTYLQQLAEWAEATDEAPPMRLYSFGGEGLAQTTFDLLSRALKARILINGYGPTETIMTPMVWKVRAGTRFEGAYAPLGRAVGDRRAYVLDADLMPCPIGVVGEIHLGGSGVARGYVGRPGTTADRFIPDPFGPRLGGGAGGRLYRSGDLGRWREDGTIEFLGRVDLQVKLNGHRIEPGEIEAALLAEPEVSEALVLLREDDGEKRLIAYVVAPARISGEALLHALEAKLPRHMLPSAVVVLDRMPTNPNAKLDRAALPLPGRVQRKALGVPAKDKAEAAILAVWREEIGHDGIGVTDDFFDMGGVSLAALKVLARLRGVWPGVALTVADLFDAPTVRGLAARIAAGDATGRSAITLRASGTKPRLYCFPGLLVSTREYLRLTDYLGPEQPVTGFLCHSLNEEKRLNVAVEEVVADYVSHIRAEAKGQPCAFLGWSWGGLLAWEAARQLQGEIDLRLIAQVDVCDLGTDFAPGATPRFAPGERDRLQAELRDWLGRTRMRPEWDRLIGAMDDECHDQLLRFIGNEADPLPTDGPEVSSREHTFWVLIDNALVFRRHRLEPLDVAVASFCAGDSLSRGLNLVDWRRLSSRATAAEIVPGTNHLHIIGDRLFHARLKARLDQAWPDCPTGKRSPAQKPPEG
ncbi:amino acid adenylation domain-containing protein [Paracoccus siganidrum]|uniref:Amino acid adenylation domain-containing protein n=2 Tax=Paracoccus siganidrum TaxID=1276757 RepID=A0A419A6D2_9RHOB|nr:amino acid adenylation domain-containing protein [Paracoccus siganidrum]RJL13071.1 amino acid adenylation domain-containing protein [Paracoccus siganidrum]RMC33027.1 non-ribosomal peptide synthetase [Paracoccus siganidrum]